MSCLQQNLILSTSVDGTERHEIVSISSYSLDDALIAVSAAATAG
jgi:hypothetical protein